MDQKAVVKCVVSPHTAQVSLMRQLECGLSCKSCEGCPQRPRDEILSLAENAVGAKTGDVVRVRSNSGSAIGIAALVYLLPCATLAAGYLLGMRLGLGEGLSVVAAFAGLLAGFAPAVMLDRALARRGRPEFTIVAIEEE